MLRGATSALTVPVPPSSPTPELRAPPLSTWKVIFTPKTREAFPPSRQRHHFLLG